MPFFIGGFDYTVDDKGRVNIPAKFRNADPKLAHSKYYIYFEEEDICLHVYTPDEFDRKMVEKVDKLSNIKKTHRGYGSIVGENVTDTFLDKQGRITIPHNFLENAKIKKKVKIIGAFSRIEIWDPKVREEYKNGLGGPQAKAKLEDEISNEMKSE